MLSRTRVAGKADVQRLASALKGPGIDTRCWTSIAIALGEIHVDRSEGKEGVFVDVQLMPTEEHVTARVGATYAGDGFGLYTPIHKDDELVIVIPSGITAEGPVVVSRMHSSVDKPTQRAADNVDDLVLVMENDKNVRVALSGQGQLEVVFNENNPEDPDAPQGGASTTVTMDKDRSRVEVTDGTSTTSIEANATEAIVDVGGNKFQVTSTAINNGSTAPADTAVLDSKNQIELARIADDLRRLRSEVAKVRGALAEFPFPLLFADLIELFPQPLIYTPGGVVNIRTGDAPNPNNTPLDADANVGEYIVDLGAPLVDLNPAGGILTQPTTPGPTASALVFIDS